MSKGKRNSSATQGTGDYLFATFAGLALAFSAGYSNGVCLSGYLNSEGLDKSVAGVTGLYTESAMDIISGDGFNAGFDFGIIGCVMAGSAFAAFMNPYALPFELGPCFAPTFLVAALLMISGAVTAFLQEIDGMSRLDFFLVATANGIQNGMSSIFSANLIRTTHLTGTTTDIGILIGQISRGNHANEWKLYILAGLAIFFWGGSAVGFVIADRAHSMALMCNAALFISIYLALVAYYVAEHKVSAFSALFGLGHWGTSFERNGEDTATGIDFVDDSGNITEEPDSEEDSDEEMSEMALIKAFDIMDVSMDGYIYPENIEKYCEDHPRGRSSILSMTAHIRKENMQHSSHDDENPQLAPISRPTWIRHVRFQRRKFTRSVSGPEQIRLASIERFKQTGYHQTRG